MSADVNEDSIIEFGVHWIEVTSRAVYEEEEREEIESGETSTVEILYRGENVISTGLRNMSDLGTFFHRIYTFLNK